VHASRIRPRELPVLSPHCSHGFRSDNLKVEVAIKKLIAKQPVKNQSALANPECLDFYANVPELQ
jgi:hypothetical protein